MPREEQGGGVGVVEEKVERVRRDAALPSLRRAPPFAHIPELRTQQRLGIKADMKTVGVLEEAFHSFAASSSRNEGEGARKRGEAPRLPRRSPWRSGSAAAASRAN